MGNGGGVASHLNYSMTVGPVKAPQYVAWEQLWLVTSPDSTDGRHSMALRAEATEYLRQAAIVSGQRRYRKLSPPVRCLWLVSCCNHPP